MNADSSSSSQASPALVGRRRLKAAQRLAAGEPVVLAAARVGVPTRVVREALAGEEDFFELVEACREIHHLPREAWFKHLEEQLRDAVDEALAAGRVSVVNQLLKATGALDEVRSASEARGSRGGAAGLEAERRVRFDGAGDGRVTAAKLLGEEAGLGPASGATPEAWRAECDRKLAALRVARGGTAAGQGDGADAAPAAEDDAGFARTIAKVMEPGHVEPDGDESEGASDGAAASPAVNRGGAEGSVPSGLTEAAAPAFEARSDGYEAATAADAAPKAPATGMTGAGVQGRPAAAVSALGTVSAGGPVEAVRFGLDASDGAEAMALASSETLAERASALLGMLGRYALPRPIGRAARHLGAVLPDAPSTFNPRALPRGPDPN